GGRGRGDDNIWVRADELHGVGAQALGIAAAPANIDPYIAAIIPSELLKAVSQRRHPALSLGIALRWRHQHADPPHPPAHHAPPARPARAAAGARSAARRPPSRQV